MATGLGGNRITQRLKLNQQVALITGSSLHTDVSAAFHSDSNFKFKVATSVVLSLQKPSPILIELHQKGMLNEAGGAAFFML